MARPIAPCWRNSSAWVWNAAKWAASVQRLRAGRRTAPLPPQCAMRGLVAGPECAALTSAWRGSPSRQGRGGELWRHQDGAFQLAARACSCCASRAASTSSLASVARHSSRCNPRCSGGSPAHLGLQAGCVGLQAGCVGLQAGCVGLRAGHTGLQAGGTSPGRRGSATVLCEVRHPRRGRIEAALVTGRDARLSITPRTHNVK